MGDLDGRRPSVEHDNLMAPIELVGFAGIEAQGTWLAGDLH